MVRKCCETATIVARRQRSFRSPGSRTGCKVVSLLPMPGGVRYENSSRSPHRQPFDRFEAGSLAPFDSGRIHRERQLRPAREQRLQGASALDAGELVAETEMDPGAEGDVTVRLALQVEPFGMRIGL